jgi:hypothetical protein
LWGNYREFGGRRTHMKNAVFGLLRRVALERSCFRGTYRLHQKGDKNRRTRNNVGRKHRFIQEPHDVPSQKTAFFIVTAMKTSNLIALTGWTQ